MAGGPGITLSDAVLYEDLDGEKDVAVPPNLLRLLCLMDKSRDEFIKKRLKRESQASGIDEEKLIGYWECTWRSNMLLKMVKQGMWLMFKNATRVLKWPIEECHLPKFLHAACETASADHTRIFEELSSIASIEEKISALYHFTGEARGLNTYLGYLPKELKDDDREPLFRVIYRCARHPDMLFSLMKHLLQICAPDMENGRFRKWHDAYTEEGFTIFEQALLSTQEDIVELLIQYKLDLIVSPERVFHSLVSISLHQDEEEQKVDKAIRMIDKLLSRCPLEIGSISQCLANHSYTHEKRFVRLAAHLEVEFSDEQLLEIMLHNITYIYVHPETFGWAASQIKDVNGLSMPLKLKLFSKACKRKVLWAVKAIVSLFGLAEAYKADNKEVRSAVTDNTPGNKFYGYRPPEEEKELADLLSELFGVWNYFS